MPYSLLAWLYGSFSAWGGARGGFHPDTRPIALNNANVYVNAPIETAIVLNTPFSVIRTIGKNRFVNPHYFSDLTQMKTLFEPIVTPPDSLSFDRKNVVVFICESFSQEYLDKGHAPFLDSLMHEGLSFDMSLSNGRLSVDAMPSIFVSIPMFVESFVRTSAALNKVGGMPYELKKKGYTTAFYHGAPNGSMGFDAFVRSIGFDHYYGMTEYCEDPDTRGMDDFDNYWAIWDDDFLQFFGRSMNQLQEPFLSSVFTATSHHPFQVPAELKDIYYDKPGELPMFKCIRYSDHALRHFFDYAKKQKWYDHTLFVFSADHTNHTQGGSYATSVGRFRVPILFYAPDGSLKQRSSIVAQQIDITPTVLGMLGYDKPYVAFGKDLLRTTPQDAYAVNYFNGIYQFFSNDYLLQFDGEQTKAVYRYRTDSLLEHNIVGTIPEQKQMEQKLKAIIQQYMERMNSDDIILK